MNNKIISKIAFTGHRSVRMSDAKSALVRLHEEYPDTTWITGGAIGADSCVAQYAMDNRIPLILVLPFPPDVMTAKWSSTQKSMLRSHIAYASKLSVLSPTYDISVYQLRNVRMVDMSDMLFGFYNGSAGGTRNCVSYAQEINHPILLAKDY